MWRGSRTVLASSTAPPPDLIKNQLGYQSTTGFRASLTRDTRDFFQDPRTGWRTSVAVSLGTQYLGGTNDFVKYTFDVNKYTPLPGDTRLSVRARYGVAQGLSPGGEEKPVPLTELYFVGGINTMRGFVFGKAGPVTSSNTLLGAASELIFNFDFIFPISAEAKLNGVMFFDYGKGFADDTVSFPLRQRRVWKGDGCHPLAPFAPRTGLIWIPIRMNGKGSSSSRSVRYSNGASL